MYIKSISIKNLTWSRFIFFGVLVAYNMFFGPSNNNVVIANPEVGTYWPLNLYCLLFVLPKVDFVISSITTGMSTFIIFSLIVLYV
jgi:hypothetical protein